MIESLLERGDLGRALQHARNHPMWSDEKIANYVWHSSRMAPWVSIALDLETGRTPRLTSHSEIVWWGFRIATALGFHAELERPILPWRGAIPDLTIHIAQRSAPFLVVEVKRFILTKRSFEIACGQVARYVAHLATIDHPVRGAVLAPVNLFRAEVIPPAISSWELADFVEALQDAS